MTCGKKVREKCKKNWKSQGISEEEKSGNPANRVAMVQGIWVSFYQTWKTLHREIREFGCSFFFFQTGKTQGICQKIF